MFIGFHTTQWRLVVKILKYLQFSKKKFIGMPNCYPTYKHFIFQKDTISTFQVNGVISMFFSELYALQQFPLLSK